MPSFTGKEVPLYARKFGKLEEELGIRLEFEIVSWNRALDTLGEAFKSGRGPDVLELGTSWVGSFAHLGYLMEVPSGFETPEPLAPWMEQCTRCRGKRVAVPWFSEAIALYARNDILERHGIEAADIADWDGYLRVCRELSSAKGHSPSTEDFHLPMTFPIRPEAGTLHRFAAFLWKSGWSFPDLWKHPQHILEDGKIVDCLNYVLRLVRDSGARPEDLQLHPQYMHDNFFYRKQYAFLVGNGAGMMGNIREDGPDGPDARERFSIFPLPFSAPDTGSHGGGAVLAVNAATRHPREAWRVVERLSEEAFVEEWSALSGNLPACDAAFWKKYAGNRSIRVVRQQILQSKSYPVHPLWSTIELLLAAKLSDFMWSSVTGRALDPGVVSLFLRDLDKRIGKLLNMTWGMKGYDD